MENKKEVAPEGSVQEQYIEKVIQQELKPFKRIQKVIFVTWILIIGISVLIMLKKISVLNDLQNALNELEILISKR